MVRRRTTWRSTVTSNLLILIRDRCSLSLLVSSSLSLLLGCLTLIFGLDQSLFIVVNQFASEHASKEVLTTLTMFGEGLWAMALISPLLLIAPRANAAALFAAPFVLVFTHLPKLLIHWPRPGTVLMTQGAHLLDAPMAMNTFPSGHAVVAGMVGAVLILGWGLLKRHPWAHLPMLVGTALVCWSRVAVGAHWPADVMVGASLGMLAGYLGTALSQRCYQDTARGSTVVFAFYAVGALALAFTRTHNPLQDQVRTLLCGLGVLCAVGAIARVQLAEQLKKVARSRRLNRGAIP